MKNEENKLELEFKKVAEETTVLIKEQMKLAAEALAKAEKLSEESGIPFYANVSPLGQSYFPSSFKNKWEYVNEDELYRLTKTYPSEYSNGEGWEHSAVC